jgi:hypothetical protein
MKPLRRHFKRWLYSSCPSYKGVFPYFGEQIHFPPGSLLFELAMNEGIFEAGNLKLLQAANGRELFSQRAVFQTFANALRSVR